MAPIIFFHLKLKITYLRIFITSLEYRIFDDSIQIIPKEKNNLIQLLES